MNITKKEKRQSVEKQIFQANTLMVLVILLLFASINLIILKIYWELIEQKINSHTLTLHSKAVYQTSEEIEQFLQELLLTGEHLLFFFILDVLLCIAILLYVSILFTKKLTRHIMQPLQALEKGASRMKSGNLQEPVLYSGDKEFEEVCLAFNEMQAHILKEQEKNQCYEKARIDMIAGISHDLRTPLTAIQGTIKGLLDKVVTAPEAQEQFLKTAYRRSQDMNQLLQKLFFFSKLETGNMSPALHRLSLSQFLQQYADTAHALPDAPFHFHTALEENLYAELDPEYLTRILDNLLENSIKYAGTSPVMLYLSLKREGQSLLCEFRDNGAGVPQEKLPHIFEEFYRGDESRNEKEGSGLGLYVVKALTTAMHGTVSAQNKEGFQITLTFPLSQGENSHE